MLTDEQKENVRNMYATAASFNGQSLRDFVRKSAKIIIELDEENYYLKKRVEELEKLRKIIDKIESEQKK